MRLYRKTYETRDEKRRDFWIGFAGWYGLNILLLVLIYLVAFLTSYLLDQGGFGSGGVDMLWSIAGWFPLLINVGGLVFLGFTRNRIALGALAAVGTALALVLLAGLCFLAACGLIRR